MGWAIFLAYVIGLLYTTRYIAVRILEDTARTNQKMRAWRKPDPGERLVDAEDKSLALMGGLLAGFIWPLALPFVVIAKGLRAPTEVAYEKERELEELRALAREHNLPMPNQEG